MVDGRPTSLLPLYRPGLTIEGSSDRSPGDLQTLFVKGEGPMTTSLIIGIAIVVAAIVLYYLAARKQRRRLDNLHITGAENEEK